LELDDVATTGKYIHAGTALLMASSAQKKSPFAPSKMMPHSVPAPAIAGLEFLTGFTLGQPQDVIDIRVFPLDQSAH
jgi:hypothetical protein